MKFITALLIATAAPLAAHGVTIDLVPVGNPNNVQDNIPGVGLFGRVTTSYRIGKTEVTNAQYVEFLNAKAATDTLSLYNTSMGSFFDGGIERIGSSGSYTYSVKTAAIGMGPGGTDYTYGDKPVNYVSWYDAVRFANWMNNGQGSGNTESGTYTISGGTAIPTNPNTISRLAGSTWFLPTENEWYKAAYYNPATTSYSDYPTGTDTAPNNALPSADTGNSANFFATDVTTGNSSYPLTASGAYALTESFYDTRDQGGNVAEWTEYLDTATSRRCRRGGSWFDPVSLLASASRELIIPSFENNRTGFRLATIAAPVSVPGDYNGNGKVDAADYVIWRKHAGTMFPLQNEVMNTSPGMVDDLDYTAWRQRFGNTSAAGAGGVMETAAVPEPSALALIVLSSTMVVIARMRRAISASETPTASSL